MASKAKKKAPKKAAKTAKPKSKTKSKASASAKGSAKVSAGSKVKSKQTAHKTVSKIETTVKANAVAKKSSVGSLKLQPLDNRIVIEVEEGLKTTPGGLFIPDTAQMTGNQKGRVIAIGTGHVSKKGKKRPLELKVGDQVLFAEYAGDKLEWNGKPVRILRESEVLGLVD